MDFQERLKLLKFEYHAELAAQCQDDQASRLTDPVKADAFPPFYDWLIQRRGFNRYQLSAHGVGRDEENSG